MLLGDTSSSSVAASGRGSVELSCMRADRRGEVGFREWEFFSCVILPFSLVVTQWGVIRNKAEQL